MDYCRLGRLCCWMARIPSLCLLMLDITHKVDASGDMRSGNHSVIGDCGSADDGSRPARGCAGSPLSHRLQSGLAVGGVCLLLLLAGLAAFAYCVRKWSKPQQTDKNCNQSSPGKNKNTKTPRSRPTKTVFTIENDRFDGLAVGELDKENLVFTDLSRKSRQHLEESFNCYSKPVEGSQSKLHAYDVT